VPMIRKVERIRFQVAQVINYPVIVTKRGSFFIGKLGKTSNAYMASYDAPDVVDITEFDLEELREEREAKRREFKSCS
jgi:hypothetical protein